MYQELLPICSGSIGDIVYGLNRDELAEGNLSRQV